MNMVTTPKFIAFIFAFALLVITIIFDIDGFIFIIDHANLLFHEAGHKIFGIFGSTLGLYGGTKRDQIIQYTHDYECPP